MFANLSLLVSMLNVLQVISDLEVSTIFCLKMSRVVHFLNCDNLTIVAFSQSIELAGLERQSLIGLILLMVK